MAEKTEKETEKKTQSKPENRPENRPENKPIRACAYCRVSTMSDLQDGSFEEQTSYYRRRIEEDPDMQLVDIYGDHGKSGRYMKGRDGLNRLIKDCEDGKIDLVLCKSVSRMARNLQEFTQIVRKLTALGVTVEFEKESIRTDSVGGNLLLGILSTLAAEESNSLAQNINWSRKRQLELGQPWGKARYGYVSVGKEHKWEIVPDEAEIVRKAYRMAGLCHSFRDILLGINQMEMERGSDRIWSQGMLVALLRSEVYIGDYLSNKECVIVDSSGNRKRVRNTGQAEQVFIEGHHEPIVSRELYGVVQELLDRGTLGSNRVCFSPEEREVIKRAAEITAAEMEKSK